MNKKKSVVVMGLVLLLSMINISSMFGNAVGVDVGTNEEINIDYAASSLEEVGDGIYYPNWDRMFGPFFHLWLEADLSTKEFVYFRNKQDAGINNFQIYIEFLGCDSNDESYLKWAPGLIEHYDYTWDHKDPGSYDYWWFYFETVCKSDIKYSNGRIQLRVHGFHGGVFLTHVSHPIHDVSKPRNPAIIGPTYAKPGLEYSYTFFSREWNNKDLEYYIDWGDGNIENWIGPYESLEAFTLTHSWESTGTYHISVKARKANNPTSDPSKTTTIIVTVSNKINIDIDGAMNNIHMPINQQYNSQSTPSTQQYESQSQQSIPLSNPLFLGGQSNNN